MMDNSYGNALDDLCPPILPGNWTGTDDGASPTPEPEAAGADLWGVETEPSPPWADPPAGSAPAEPDPAQDPAQQPEPPAQDPAPAPGAADSGGRAAPGAPPAPAPVDLETVARGEVQPRSPHTGYDGVPKAPRDLRREVETMRALFPGVKEIPDPVAQAVARGVPLLSAFLVHREQEREKQTEALRRENRLLRQNADNAARAPVKGVSGGAGERGRSLFEQGFDAGLSW